MKIVKKIIVIFVIFIVSGCSVKYNLTVNEDGSVNETVVAEERTSKMESLTRLKGDNAVNYLYKMFNRGDNEISISSTTDTYNTYATAVKVHKSLDEYVSNFKSDVFSNMNLTRKDNIVTLETNQNKLLGDNSNYSLIYDEIIVSIKVPYKVVESSADSVSGNTYKWTINKNTGLKNIKISYEEGSKKDSINIKIKDKTYNINYIVISISGIILLVLLLIFKIYRKNKKNNAM